MTKTFVKFATNFAGEIFAKIMVAKVSVVATKLKENLLNLMATNIHQHTPIPKKTLTSNVFIL